MDAMAEIRQTFFEECAEQLAELEAGLLAIENGEADADTVNAVFRAVHSIKGGAGAFSLDDLVRFSHIFETTLDELRSDRLEASDVVIKVMLRAADALADLVTVARDGGTVDASRNEGLAAELKDLVAAAKGETPADAAADAPEPEDSADSADSVDDDFGFVPVAVDLDELIGGGGGGDQAYRIIFRPHAALYAKANDSVRVLRDLLELGEGNVQCDTSEIPLLSDLDPEGAYFTFTVDLTTVESEEKIREVFEFVEDDCDLSIERILDSDTGSADGAVDVDSDLADLLASLRGEAASDAAADEAPAAKAPKADKPKASKPVMADQPAPAPAAAPEAAAASSASAPVEKPAKADASEAKSGNVGGSPAQTIRVDLERVDRLIDLVGELVIHQVMLSQRTYQAGLARASEVAVGLDELEQLTREIQDSVMAIRAQPVKSVFQRLPRLAREVAEISGKTVRLVTEGEWTEVDKTVIERLADPLTHMLRNAIDHGLEKPDVRLAAGKSEEGTVKVAAMHRSGRIVIEISDDGAGINRPKVREIAISKGLVAAEANLSDEEIDNLIFMPGFSTASEISELSGRGVGMDVVKRSIQALGGRVSITSKPGKGSTFTMSLPLTLAVLDGMIVTVGDQTAVVPLTAIIETLQPKPEEVKGFGGDARLIKVRDAFLPLVDVGRELAYTTTPTNATTGVAILVEAENGTRSALLVDAIQGQRQVVIKSLEANYRRVPGIAAATILGDGRVALILDVDVIVATSRTDGIHSNGLQQAAE
ncbi:chemotaxis protein CheA [Aurantimonas sp. C2-6-R+9]|uniref:chemotaxis protein CheA n=1 Tax=unclassified Aurantimonas TaxID=2638230 RepID=UPI002E198F15|nr:MULTISPECIES: chemotaxis protein CheA [unclassified Aurantimonas]MEC5292694.1 chemotaxis protein CheA [Aurantimonas sp. C2-3-R2]MEC5382913.1 chemotaxis protein CheA [Aurantimonas sp. C2-6-R+9]MEC5413727.1 chemotaxis protein CheA [Aurantimonas sp. C2-4-R8]